MVEPNNKKKPYDEHMEQIAAAAGTPTPMPGPIPAPADASKVVWNTKKRYVVKPSQYRAGCWIQSPGMLVLFKATDAALSDIAEQRGLKATLVEKIRAARVGIEKKVYLVPTEADDVDGLELNRNNGKITCNLVSFLAPEKLCIESGYKERYEITEAGPDSPVGPALVFDMSKVEQRRLLPVRASAKSDKAAPPPAPPAAAPEPDTTGDQ